MLPIKLTIPVCEWNLEHISIISKALQRNRSEFVDHAWAVRFALAAMARALEDDPNMLDAEDDTDEPAQMPPRRALRADFRGPWTHHSAPPGTPIASLGGAPRTQRFECSAGDDVSCHCSICGGPLDAE